jgi:hypothetical protein
MKEVSFFVSTPKTLMGWKLKLAFTVIAEVMINRKLLKKAA